MFSEIISLAPETPEDSAKLDSGAAALIDLISTGR